MYYSLARYPLEYSTGSISDCHCQLGIGSVSDLLVVEKCVYTFTAFREILRETYLVLRVFHQCIVLMALKS